MSLQPAASETLSGQGVIFWPSSSVVFGGLPHRRPEPVSAIFSVSPASAMWMAWVYPCEQTAGAEVFTGTQMSKHFGSALFELMTRNQNMCPWIWARFGDLRDGESRSLSRLRMNMQRKPREALGTLRDPSDLIGGSLSHFQKLFHELCLIVGAAGDREVDSKVCIRKFAYIGDHAKRLSGTHALPSAQLRLRLLVTRSTLNFRLCGVVLPWWATAANPSFH